MKSLIISHESALSYWRASQSSQVNYVDSPRMEAVLGSTPEMLHSKDLKLLEERFGLDRLPRPLCFLVPEASRRNKIKEATFRCMAAPPPERSFAVISAYSVMQGEEFYELLSASPELCFVQLGKLLDIYELIELGNELCGRYSLLGNSEGMSGRQSPLTSVSRLEHFVESAHDISGIRRARHALQYVVDNSWSPKESQIAAMLSLPRCMGGFGITKPIMNREICVSGEAARVLRGSKLIPDMYWPDIRTVLEYDSKSKHCDAVSVDHDARKRSTYRLLGVDVMTVTLGQLNDFASFSALADDLYLRFGKRRRSTTAAQRIRQRDVHRWYLHGTRKAPVPS